MSFDGQSADDQKPAHWFATTHWSVVLSARQTDSPQAAAALEKLCSTYWYPLYAYVRRRGNDPHAAQDLVQEFFAHLLSNGNWLNIEAGRGKFRSFLEAALGKLRAEFTAAKKGAQFERLKNFLEGDVGPGDYEQAAREMA